MSNDGMRIRRAHDTEEGSAGLDVVSSSAAAFENGKRFGFGQWLPPLAGILLKNGIVVAASEGVCWLVLGSSERYLQNAVGDGYGESRQREDSTESTESG